MTKLLFGGWMGGRLQKNWDKSVLQFCSKSHKMRVSVWSFHFWSPFLCSYFNSREKRLSKPLLTSSFELRVRKPWKCLLNILNLFGRVQGGGGSGSIVSRRRGRSWRWKSSVSYRHKSSLNLCMWTIPNSSDLLEYTYSHWVQQFTALFLMDLETFYYSCWP